MTHFLLKNGFSRIRIGTPKGVIHEKSSFLLIFLIEKFNTLKFVSIASVFIIHLFHLFKWKFNMKKILFFAAIIAISSAFIVINHKKTTTNPKNLSKETLALNEKLYAENMEPYENENAEKPFSDEATFAKLLEQFQKGTLPFSLNSNILREQIKVNTSDDYLTKNKRVMIEHKFLTFFPDMLKRSMFARSPEPLPEPYLAFAAKDKHILLYLTNHWGRKTYYVSVFDAKGNSLSEKLFASASFNKIMAATLDENLELTHSNYDVIWDKKTDKDGLKNAKIKELKLTKMTVESLIKKESEKEIKIEKNATVRANP
jgi:hypothetical protein